MSSDKKKINENDLFNNPMVKAAKQSLSQEQLEEYKKIGENLYHKMDTEGKIKQNLEENLKDTLWFIESQIKSGLHPSDMDEDYINILTDKYGDKWYEKFGYCKNDLKYITGN